MKVTLGFTSGYCTCGVLGPITLLPLIQSYKIVNEQIKMTFKLFKSFWELCQ